MSEQEDLRRLLVQLGDQFGGWGEITITPGELTMWRWTGGAMMLTATVDEPPGNDKVDVVKINGEGRVVGCSPGMISWALERVRRHMILEELSRV